MRELKLMGITLIAITLVIIFVSPANVNYFLSIDESVEEVSEEEAEVLSQHARPYLEQLTDVFKNFRNIGPKFRNFVESRFPPKEDAISIPIVSPQTTQAPAVVIQESQGVSVVSNQPIITSPSLVKLKPDSVEGIKLIQTKLQEKGFYQGAIDGKIGRATRKAIKDFQSTRQLKADGVMGPKTWEELKK